MILSNTYVLLTGGQLYLIGAFLYLAHRTNLLDFDLLSRTTNVSVGDGMHDHLKGATGNSLDDGASSPPCDLDVCFAIRKSRNCS